MNKRILDAVRQEHERADGSGYPRGLVKEEIGEYAQIVGLADVYEAMMHRRPYRGKYTSLETVRIILKNKKVFSRKAIKALIEVFGLFPVDTLVQLNTKEIGVIVERNDDCISRPVIDVLIDSYGKELKQPRRVNMAENPVLYIDTCVKTQMDNPKV
jgi:HD-GYP domain-containing protein (c-di-GMP phosphodiesterase class II)